CDQLEVDAAAFIGNSMGGFACAEQAIRSPARVERLVLVSAAGVAEKYVGLPTAFITHPTAAMAGRLIFAYAGVPHRQALRIARRPRLRHALLKMLLEKPSRLSPEMTYELVRSAGAPGAAQAAIALASYDFKHRVNEIACPTLVLWGDRDWIVPGQGADEFER